MGHSGAPIHGFYNPCDNMIWTQTGAYPQYMITPSYHMRQQPFEQQQQAFEQPHQPNFEQHTKDCPRSRRNSGYAGTIHRTDHYPNKDPYLNPLHQQVSYGGQVGPDFTHSHIQPGHLSYLPSKEFRQVMALPSSHHTNPPSQWSADEEEMKYGPFSDGEADTMKKGTRLSRKCVRGRGLAAPHYATMSRVAQANTQHSSLDTSRIGEPSLKYTSQPQLNSRHLGDYLGHQGFHPAANSEALTPLSLKTSITFPRKPPLGAQPRPPPQDPESWGSQSKPWLERPRQDLQAHMDLTRRHPNGIPHSQANGAPPQPYPDLARHPLSYSQVPPKRATPLRYNNLPLPPYPGPPPNMSRSLIQQGQNSSDDTPQDYEHSRSSSVGDIPVGMNGHDPRMATPDGYASLPYDSTLPSTRPPTIVKAKRKPRSGAVRVDLSFADKSIRWPGSAPDLVNNDDPSQLSPGGSIRSNKRPGGLTDRGRSTSSERESVVKKLGTPATRKVAFVGIEDEDEDESEESDSEKDTVNSCDEEVWAKQPERTAGRAEEPVAVSGVVVAAPAPLPRAPPAPRT